MALHSERHKTQNIDQYQRVGCCFCASIMQGLRVSAW